TTFAAFFPIHILFAIGVINMNARAPRGNGWLLLRESMEDKTYLRRPYASRWSSTIAQRPSDDTF
ncbi:MAG: hypothetical protein OSB46_05570, partial [Alphaproteobacteria bacterium]|nr:hypothetical protein [Alphaproteobacteria bacterium]